MAKRKSDAPLAVVDGGKIEIVKGHKALDKLVNVTIPASRDELKKLIHQACVSAAYHAAEHGNCTLVNDLCGNVEQVTHNNAVRLWFHEYRAFTMVRWSTKKKAFVMNTELRSGIIDEAGKARPEQLEEIAGKLFNTKKYFELTKPSEFKPINLLGKIKALIKKIDELEPEERNIKGNDFRGLEEIRGVLQRMNAA